MKAFRRISWLLYYPAVVTAVLQFSVHEAFATDTANNWRHTYDSVMMWVNFIILAFLLVKFGKKPLMNFLHGRKEDLARQLERIEEEKKKAEASVEESLKQLDESAARFEKIRERIIEQGERNKQAIIEEAHLESKILLEGAKRKINNEINMAKKKYRDEMIDKAMDIVIEKLPREMTDQDNQELTRQYLDSTLKG
jgi:F-type H+-transporting ATPase subunit b